MTTPLSRGQRRAVALAALLVVTPVAGAAAAGAFGPPVERNAAYTDAYEPAYEPFEPSPPADSLVLLPDPYGPWLNHPFQYLRNDPGFDGRAVYALDREAPLTWAVLDAFPDRTPYRYRYRGTWTPAPGDAVEPRLTPAERVRTDALAATTRVGVPEGATSATVAVSADGETARRTVTPDGGTLAVEWRIDGGTFASGDASVPLEGPTEAELSVVVVGRQGGTVAYELEVLVRPVEGGIEAVWPPEPQVCVGATTCGDAYVPGSRYPSFVELETERR